MVVTRSAEAHAGHLASLLPRGDLWQPDADPVMRDLLLWFGREFAKVDRRIADVLREADPRRAVEMLPDWEAEVGLPDECSGLAVSLSARQAQVVQKLAARGGSKRSYFIHLAETLGYPGATITEFPRFNCRSACNAVIGSIAWQYTWRLNLPSTGEAARFMARSACNEPLKSWAADATLECVIRRLKPAHTHVQFAYVETP